VADVDATPSARLALRDERDLVREGYRFLDEKRLLLAAEVLRELDVYAGQHAALLALYDEAARGLAAAVAVHGLEGLQVHPATPGEAASVERHGRTFLGVPLQSAELKLPAAAPVDAVLPSPEARRVAELFRRLLTDSARLAALTGNLERLLAEYRRTERRARALEDVLLPELEATLAEVEQRLEEQELEEAVRVRLRPPADSSPATG
jgi:V/A-type H+-transporting ATPase subunit D